MGQAVLILYNWFEGVHFHRRFDKEGASYVASEIPLPGLRHFQTKAATRDGRDLPHAFGLVLKFHLSRSASLTSSSSIISTASVPVSQAPTQLFTILISTPSELFTTTINLPTQRPSKMYFPTLSLAMLLPTLVLAGSAIIQNKCKDTVYVYSTSSHDGKRNVVTPGSIYSEVFPLRPES